MNTNLSIGGVPEHFNLPWQEAIRKDVFGHSKLNISWTFFSGGTGAMTKALMSKEIDLAILLTEGFVSALNQGLKAKIVKVYIDSPLPWGIYTGMGSKALSIKDFGKYAISRIGSGSHLMPIIHANQIEKTIDENQLVIVNSLDGAIQSLESGESTFFYWEKIMTQPYVDQNRVRPIGEFSAPWSGFLIVATDEAIEKKAKAISAMLQDMNAFCGDFISNPTAPSELSGRYAMNETEATQWLKKTLWSNDFSIRATDLENARIALSKVKMCDPNLNLETCLAPWMNLIK